MYKPNTYIDQLWEEYRTISSLDKLAATIESLPPSSRKDALLLEVQRTSQASASDVSLVLTEIPELRKELDILRKENMKLKEDFESEVDRRVYQRYTKVLNSLPFWLLFCIRFYIDD